MCESIHGVQTLNCAFLPQIRLVLTQCSDLTDSRLRHYLGKSEHLWYTGRGMLLPHEVHIHHNLKQNKWKQREPKLSKRISQHQNAEYWDFNQPSRSNLKGLALGSSPLGFSKSDVTWGYGLESEVIHVLGLNVTGSIADRQTASCHMTFFLSERGADRNQNPLVVLKMNSHRFCTFSTL